MSTLAQSKRLSTAVGIVLIAAAALVIILATRASGSPAVDLDLNTGSAWLVSRTDGATARVNGAVHEAETLTFAASPGDDFVVLQSSGVLVVHNRTESTLTPLDSATSATGPSLSIPADAEVDVAGSSILVHRPSAGEIWMLDFVVDGLEEVDLSAPTFATSGSTLAGLALDGSAHVFDRDAQSVRRFETDGSEIGDPTSVPVEARQLTTFGGDTVLSLIHI